MDAKNLKQILHSKTDRDWTIVKNTPETVELESDSDLVGFYLVSPKYSIVEINHESYSEEVRTRYEDLETQFEKFAERYII